LTIRDLRSLTKQKKHLNFTALKKVLSSHFNAIDDPRQQGKCEFSYHDVLMSAFAYRDVGKGREQDAEALPVCTFKIHPLLNFNNG